MCNLKPYRNLIIAAAFICIGMVADRLRPPENPDALWQIVSTKCMPDQAQHGDSKPCVAVDKDYAVLKDRKGESQFLLIPTARITGIEDPVLAGKDAPNYFADAWEARRFTEQALKKQMPRQEIALAVNSKDGRTQNQLHIHIDCLRRDVRNSIAKHAGEIKNGWTDFPVPLMTHHYRARRVEGETLGSANPFVLLAEDAQGDTGDETLVVAGATFENGKPGFVLLRDKANLAQDDHASGAELLDHKCAAAHEFAP